MFGSAIVYSGFVLIVAGLALAARPMRRRWITTRSRGLLTAGAGVSLAVVGLILPASESQQVLRSYPVEVQALAHRARRFLLKSLPHAEERVDSSAPVSSYSTG
jgi:hypothetical protein